MNTKQIRSISTRLGTSVGLTCDPTADPRERWIAVVGLDALGAGRTPEAALRATLGELAEQRAGNGTAPSARRGRLILRTAPK